MSRNANMRSQLLVGHAVGATDESRNQVLLFFDPGPGHDPFKRGVIVVIELRDDLARQQGGFFFRLGHLVPLALVAFSFCGSLGHGLPLAGYAAHRWPPARDFG